MFQKAKVEAVICNNLGDKEAQFRNWNATVYDKIVDDINKTVESHEEYSIFPIEFKKDIKLKTVSRFFNRIPDNSLIVSDYEDGNSYSLCCPFLSSHIMLPVKPGEVVWTFNYDKENESYESQNFIKKSYWISRVHGESFNEDLNYTHHDRTFMSTFVDFTQDDLIQPFISEDIKSLIKKNQELYNNFTLQPVVRSQKNPEDLILQGSRNNAIKLTGTSENSGKITLVSGQGKINKTKTEALQLNFQKLRFSRFNTDSNLSNTIENSLGSYENFKYPNFYEENLLKNYSFSENFYEGETDLANDASVLTISEKFDYEDYYGLYNLNLKNRQGKNFGLVPSDKEIEVTPNKKYKRLVSQKSNYDTYFKMPGIIEKSNNITLVARKETTKFKSGKICLIKDSDYYEGYGHIILDSDGSISIDGSKITIGTLSRNENLKHGEGNLIQLGHSNEMEPIVKGEYLKATLEQLILYVQDGFEKIAQGMDSLSKHTHPHPFGPTSPPTDPTRYTKIKSNINKESNIQKEMKLLSDNLNNILSKLVRTS